MAQISENQSVFILNCSTYHPQEETKDVSNCFSCQPEEGNEVDCDICPPPSKKHAHSTSIFADEQFIVSTLNSMVNKASFAANCFSSKVRTSKLKKIDSFLLH